MIVVIQCAARKYPCAGRFKMEDGRPIMFVADPKKAPTDNEIVYKRPDDPSGSGLSYREELVKYNHRRPGDNPLGLLRAWELYSNPGYEKLVDTFCVRNVFILSAGWGLIPADFLTPDYDITFSSSAKGNDAYKRRRRNDAFMDLSMLPADSIGPIVFLGGKDYVSLFRRLTEDAKSERIVFYRYGGSSDNPPAAPGCRLLPFETSTRTNWHYECAKALMQGKITV